MTILVLSADEEAARSLCSALTRSGQQARWQARLDAARELARTDPPLVFVADTSVEGYDGFCAEVSRASPSVRVFLLSDRASAPSASDAQILFKPFDAAEVAALLAGEHELAEVDRRRRGLEARTEELALLVEASFEAIVGLSADGTIQTWNPGAATIYGWSREEAIGRPVDILEVHEGAAAIRLGSAENRALEVRRKRKDGSELLVLLSLARVPVDAGVPAEVAIRFAEVSLDITERRKLERALEHGERLAAIGRIAASMAHEINNPLAVIRASASRVAQLAAEMGHTELAECAADTDFAAERIGSFVQHVCGFARRERPVLSDLPIRATVDMAMRLVRPRALERGVIVFFEQGPDPRVVHDPPRMGQALMNVLSNAIDAAAAGGKNVAIRIAPEPQEVRIEVDDDGAGIAPEIAGKLFEAFATTKPPGQGTGLGLSITRQILEDHGGSVSLATRAEGGTRAVLALPSQDLARFMIVVVEPDPAVRRALATDVGRGGFRVRAAGSLHQARQMLEGQEVHAVLTDVVLPDGSAIALLEELRATRPSVGRIVVTTTPTDTTASVAHARIEKPWNYERLIAAVRQVCLGA
ncbi:MAG: response regulator [Deltaproteobacteria bacterium]|nr:response regulator [Deltaproteobacteria bacterium]